MDTNEAMKKFAEKFGSRLSLIGFQVITLSISGQPCDVTFPKRKPALNVTIDQQIGLAITYCAGAEKLMEIFEKIKLSNGETVNLKQIWTINPMPSNGFTEAELASVDLAEAEEQASPNGDTLRTMIRNTYHCSSRDEEDTFLRRFIAS